MSVYPVPMPELVAIRQALLDSRQLVRLGLTDLPEGPGIYGLYGDAEAWADLGFGELEGDGLLYLGLTLDGLNRRVIQTHFANRKTPWSIVRRSLASLLRSKLGLVAESSGSEAHRHFSLGAKSDRALSAWMRSHLQVGIWEHDELDVLQDAERLALDDWAPGLSPYGPPSDRLAQVEAARLSMTEVARSNLPAPIQSLLHTLSSGDAVEPLGQGKPTFVVGFDHETILLESELSRSKDQEPQTIPTNQFVAAYATLMGEGTLNRAGLMSQVQRRSAFVFAALAQIEGVSFVQKPLSLRYDQPEQ